MLQLTRIATLWPEHENFSLSRPDTGEEYIFIHLLSPAMAKIGGVWQKLRRGGCYIVPPHSDQGLKADGGPLLHNWLHMRGDVAACLAAADLVPDRVYYPAKDDFLTDLFRDLEGESLSQRPLADPIISLKLQTLFLQFSRALKEQGAPPSTRLFRRLCSIRSEALLHYDTPISVPDMAKKTGLSTSRFHCLYKQYFGISPADDLAKARLEHAKRLLCGSDMTVTAAAEALGYTSVYHFIRQFRRKTGITPGAYRAASR